MSADVLYYSCPFDLSGYGTVARNHLLGMAKEEELNVRLRTKKFWTGVSPDLGADGDILKGLEQTKFQSGDKHIFIEHLTPENFFIDPLAKHHIAYTPFETDGVPPSWLLPLKGMDEIWVPSQHNKDSYIKAGLDANKILVVPHGVDVEKYNPNVAPLRYNHGAFNFGSVFDWTERKNPQALVKAYYNAFHRGEDVTLTLRTFWRFPIEKSREALASAIEYIKDSYPDRTEFPKILFWYDTMDESIMPNFFKSFDCFCLPSRGEGFGLPFLEAMACGVPTIGPNWGGNTEFMKDTNSFLVGGKVKPVDDQLFLRLQPQYGGQNWFDVDCAELGRAMRWVYENKELACKIAEKGVTDIQEHYKWSDTVKIIKDRLLSIEEKLSSAGTIRDDMSYMEVA